MLEISFKDLQPFLNTHTKFILRPDATLTITNIQSRQKTELEKFYEEFHEKDANIDSEVDNQNDKNQLNNSKEDGYIFGYQAKRRLKNYVLSAAINGKLDGKNTMFATFTFTNSLSIKEYNAPEHDDILVSIFTKFLNNLKINHGLKDYTWIAERHTGKRSKKEQKGQSSKKGWLHFHSILVFDNFFDIQLLNYLWLKRINKDERLQCQFSTLETLNNTIGSIKSNPKKHLALDNRNISSYFSTDNWLLDVSSNFIISLQEAHNQNNLRLAQPLAYEQNNIKAIKTLSGFLLNPVDVEFFGYDSKNTKLEQSESLRKVLNYVTTYISKADNGKAKEYFENQEFEIEHKIYARIWSASRLFTSQKHKTNLDLEQATQLLEKSVLKIIESNIEVISSVTGEIKKIPVYTVVFKFDIYKNQTYLNYFKDESVKNLLPDKSTFSRLLPSELPTSL